MSSLFNANYFLSEKIKVFPCAYRNSTYDATARLNTEYNFIHLPHMVDKPSYIIKFDTEELICVIQGYYFEIVLGAGDYNTLYNSSTDINKDTYLNIRVASPNSSNSTDFIEGPHLCRWKISAADSIDIESLLDAEQATSDGNSTYLFGGLKITTKEPADATKDDDGANYTYYALKLDASAKLPISANKIENNAGIPISSKFTTGTLSATTSTNTQSLNVASNKLTANSTKIIARVPVTINNTLEVKNSTATTSILEAGSDKVTIHKPTSIEGANSNLTVAGKGNFGGKLTITAGGADITGATILKGTTEIKNSSDELIFSVDTASGETYAKKINVATSIAETPITDIFGSTSNKIDRLKLRIIEPDTDATWVPGADQSVKIILKKDTDPVKTKAVSFFLAKGDTATVVKADEFIGVAETAQAFKFPATISLSGDVAGSVDSTFGWSINTEIVSGKVTNDKLAGDIANDKLVNSSITIGGSSVSLGGSIGTSNKKIEGTLYGDRLNLSGDMVVNNIANIKVKNASLKSASALKVVGSTVNLCNSALVVASDSIKIGGNKLTLYASNGNIESKGTITAVSFNATSDRRLKENIIDYKPERSILDLPIKKFDFIDGPKNQIGCIAQDLKEICPEIVNEDKNGYLSIQESKLVYLLLDEVKKLKNEVEELKNK